MFMSTSAPTNRMWVQTKPSFFETKRDWADSVNNYFVHLEMDSLDKNNFKNITAVQDFGSVNISEIIASAQRVRRTKSLASRSESVTYKLNIQLSGRTQITQNNKVALLNPGDWGLYDTSQPYEVYVDDKSHFLVLQFKEPSLDKWEQDIRLSVGKRLDFRTGGAKVAVDALHSLLLEWQSLQPNVADSIALNILQMLALSIGTGLPAKSNLSNLEAVRLQQLDLILKYIRDNIADPNLSTNVLAAKFRVSRRYLYNIFAIKDLSPGDYINTTRLERSKLMLSDYAANYQISEVASYNGFSDASVFSHAFRRRYGLSPSKWKRNNQSMWLESNR